MPASEPPPNPLKGLSCGLVIFSLLVISFGDKIIDPLCSQYRIYKRVASPQQLWTLWILISAALFLLLLFIIIFIKKTAPMRAEYRKRQVEINIKQEQQRISLENTKRENKQHLLAFIQQNFLVQPCFSCHEFTMRFLGISPNNRSIQYQCVHCGKKMRAAAGTPDAAQVGDIWRAYCGFNRVSLQPRPEEWGYGALNLVFETVPAPMPYEQTTRTPIPEAVRAEVWRRDQGRCVNCGSKENLHFDHIIPVSRGGGTSAKNLQLLCQSCNFTKGAKI